MKFYCTLFLLLSINVFSQTSEVYNFELECGDIQESYVESDLSLSFKNTFVDIETIKAEGFTYIQAGRNCSDVMRNEHKYHVLIAQAKKREQDHRNGPLEIDPGSFDVSVMRQSMLENGIILTSEESGPDTFYINEAQTASLINIDYSKGEGKTLIVLRRKPRAVLLKNLGSNNFELLLNRKYIQHTTKIEKLKIVNLSIGSKINADSLIAYMELAAIKNPKTEEQVEGVLQVPNDILFYRADCRVSQLPNIELDKVNQKTSHTVLVKFRCE